MAGIAAAYWLRKWGVHSIILEARERLGGRIRTSCKWADEPVDLGASWLTHTARSPLATLVKKFDIQTVSADLVNLTLREADGWKLSRAETAALFALFRATYVEVRSKAVWRSARQLPDIPLAAELARVITRRRLSPETRRRLGFFINLLIGEQWATRPDDLSLYHWDCNRVLSRGGVRIFPNGYEQLVERMASGLDLRLDHNVIAVEYDPRGVTVSTNRGVFRASHA